MDTLQAIGIFVRAVELGSLSSVARERGTTQPTISKTIAAAGTLRLAAGEPAGSLGA